MKKILFAILSITLLIALVSSTFFVSAESAVTQQGEAKTVQATLPVVDGKIDDVWANTTAHNIDIIKVGTDTGVKAYFKLLWTPTALYGLVVVPDTTPNHDATDDYKKDTVEIALDFSNARTEAYENNDQMNLRFYANGDELLVARDGNGTVSLDQVSWAVTPGADGYVCEFAVACDKLGIAMSADKVIGIDVQVNDNAEGIGERTGCYAWNDDGDAVYNNPTYMGEVKLVSASADIAEAVGESAPADDTVAPEAAEAPVATPVPAAPKTSDAVVFPIILLVLAAAAFVTVKKVKTTR